MKLWGLQQITNEERENILSQHRELYNGYQTMQPKVPSEQPLYVQDFAKDKVGAVMSNKGNVKAYTNVGINEQVEAKEVCDECGGIVMEGECSECGWKGEVGAMEGEVDENWGTIARIALPIATSYLSSKMGETNEELEEKSEVCSECGSVMREGECSECGYKMEETKEGHKTGKLSDIYNVEDLGDDEFDYVEGGGNKYGTFEKMHHMKGIKNEQLDNDYEDPDNEDDDFEDLQASSGPMFEQGYTGGGNAPDMDLSNIKAAYDFVSDGPMAGGDVYPTEGELDEDHMDTYEPMKSAWDDDELEEANDVSGVQGMYGAMKPAYDFDSEGPGKAGPYQHSSWGGGSTHEDEDAYRESDLEDDELDLDLAKFNPEDKSWEEITAHTGSDEFSHLDEETKLSLSKQKDKILEMFHRMKVLK